MRRCAAIWTGTLPESPTPLAGPLGALMLRAAVSNIPPGPDRGPSTMLLERTQQLQDMLDRAEARGELTPSVEELLELVVALLYLHALSAGPPAPSTPAVWWTAFSARRLPAT